MDVFGTDAQAGFCPDCTTTDGIFTMIVGLQKRKEHGLETWTLFIEFFNAFDTVPWEALFAILRRFSSTDHFVSISIHFTFTSTL